MRILIEAVGSHGDIHPFLALGKELARRRHDVVFFANAHFTPETTLAGLRHVALGSEELYLETVANPNAVDPKKGLRLIAGIISDNIAEAHALVDSEVEENDTLLVGSTLAFASRLVHEARAVPLVIGHLAPSVFRSVFETPQVTETPFPRWLPPLVKGWAFRFADAFIVDPAFARAINRFRRTLGLPPVKRVFQDWIHDADLVLGLFPEWFAEPQPDWPAQARLTGFPLYDGGGSGLSREIETFLDEGPPPVAFTAGTATATEDRFFRDGVEACRRTGRRGLLFARHDRQIPTDLPEGVRHFAYAPFSLLLPRVAAFVHHGGIGTMSQAIAAGVPQLVRPMAFDQFDNAARAVRLGVARSIPARRFTPENAAEALEWLTASPSVREACRAGAGRVSGVDTVARTCDEIEAAAPRRPSTVNRAGASDRAPGS